MWSLLNKVARILLDNAIDYIVAWGLLLGFTRQQDFIGSDDDVDVVLKSSLALLLAINWASHGLHVYLPAADSDAESIVSIAFASNHAREYPFIEFYRPDFDAQLAALSKCPSIVRSVYLSPYKSTPILLSFPSDQQAINAFLRSKYGKTYMTIVQVAPSHRPWATTTPRSADPRDWPAFVLATGRPLERRKRRRISEPAPTLRERP
jgi:hypothetical protein